MKEQSYPKSARLRKSRQYRWIQRVGQKISGRYLLFQWTQTPSTRPSRLGLTVSAKYGPSVARNLFKRRIKELFRSLRIHLSPGSAIHIKPMGQIKHARDVASFEELSLEWHRHLKVSGLLRPQPLPSLPIVAGTITDRATDGAASGGASTTGASTTGASTTGASTDGGACAVESGSSTSRVSASVADSGTDSSSSASTL